MDSSTLTCTPRRRRTTIAELPNELLFAIFPLLPLKPLIAAKNVCQHWRMLVHESHLSPARRKLLDLFEQIVAEAPRDAQRPRVSQCYCDSDREEYLAFLTRSASAPEEFVAWVREWPAWGVFGWLWPGLDENKRRPAHALRRPLLELAALGGVGGFGLGAYGWSEPISVAKPHVKCITFSGGCSPFEPGVILRVTKVVPVEFAGIGIQTTGFMTEGDGMEVEAGIELIVLCFGGGNRALILDGKNGGEELKGLVYQVVEGYTLEERTVCAKTWIEYLRKHLMIPHPAKPPVKFHAEQPTTELFALIEPF
ncbi:uncharacterized protein PHACADRAFT_201014 [Phanerochaete carnosa HHB-10118-sp]|uniref:F-box domain-containing protein n=1 Tax=Phanerochaete carnosa (strain HHB-10118-sp) TaxID=650164 RepID=K5UKK4_PHACS|nr:uncharacterized protein PHACADRAFT_201014 [Phanerochaete carnosa HHB-10118-sp]EKM50171.1 hypothetical protein PHACADRAFT_201014 [Phanerochaete carnosa HHB-10118-sp]